MDRKRDPVEILLLIALVATTVLYGLGTSLMLAGVLT
jgi:F0F1-type ATP synthase membrane subunit c/vacuolar-type H+-ATPase subunit K